MAEHPEFANNPVKPIIIDLDVGADDELGHGTSVASIIGGSKSGVAKSATLYSLKALRNGQKQLSDSLSMYQGR
jgi:subtilisin family serine protease